MLIEWCDKWQHCSVIIAVTSFLFLSDEETLDYTIRIGSTPTFLYFDLHLYSAYAAHYVYCCNNLLTSWNRHINDSENACSINTDVACFQEPLTILSLHRCPAILLKQLWTILVLQQCYSRMHDNNVVQALFRHFFSLTSRPYFGERDGHTGSSLRICFAELWGKMSMSLDGRQGLNRRPGFK